jgi:peptidoglycan-associated lipoprotein
MMMTKHVMRTTSAALALLALAACAQTTPENTNGGFGKGDNQDPRTSVTANPSEQLRQEFANTVGDRVYFETDKAELTADAKAVLDRQANWLARRNSDLKVLIEGHADERGTREYNFALGERRAKAVVDYLKARGIGASRMRLVSYGKERPAVLGSDDAAWSQNRRSVTVIE